MKLVPLGDRVVLKQVEAEETTASGIVLPGQAQEKPQQAEVIAVGPGGIVNGKEVKMEVEVGNTVIYSKYAGTEVKMDGTDVICSFHLNFCSCIFGVDNSVSNFYFHLNFFTVYNSARANCDNLCLLWFLLCLSRKYDSGCCCLFCFNLF